MKTALYVRVSSKQQIDGTSLDFQEEACRNRAIELGVTTSNMILYREEGASGEDIDRPKMNELREDVKNGIVSRVIVLHPDRFSRELTDKLLVCSEFESKGVELIFVDTEYADTPEGQLFFNMQSVIAQYELAMIKKRTRRGIISAAKKGQYLPSGTPTFGYEYIDGILVINKEEAEYVKMIFNWYINEGYTIRKIGETLFEMGAKPKKGTRWSHSSIQKIIANETYTGRYYYNRTKSTKLKGTRTPYGNPKLKRERREKDDWILIPVTPIIDEEVYEKARKKREENKTKTGQQKYDYLFKGKLKCGHCGGKYSSFVVRVKNKAKRNTRGGKPYYEYRKYTCCKSHQRRSYGGESDKCLTSAIKADNFESYIWNEVARLISDKDLLKEAYETQDEGLNENMLKIYKNLKSKIDKKTKEKDRIILLFKKGLIEIDEMESDLKLVNNDLKTLNSEIEKYSEIINRQTKSNEEIKLLEGLVEDLSDALKDHNNLPFEFKKKVIDLLFDDIIITYDDLSKKKDRIMNVQCTGLLSRSFSEIRPRHLELVDENNKYLTFNFEARAYYETYNQISIIPLNSSIHIH